MNPFASARQSSHLDEGLFAQLLELEPARLRALEADGAEPTPSEIDRCARLFGLRVRDLLAGAVEQAPMTLLLRSAYEGGSPSLPVLQATGAQRVLGDFLRATRDMAELESLLGRPAAVLPRLVAPATASLHPAERRARSLRDHLALGIEPIPSMCALVARLGVRVFFTTPDELDPWIDGASTHTPRPAILVNLIGGGDLWWRTRMTLAHELSHLLFDGGVSQVLFSPRHPPSVTGGWRWRLFDGFDDIEVQADAFAACFLAPAEGVRRCVGALAKDGEAAISAVGAHFGVGRTVAINRLQDVFNLPREVRVEMESRPARRYEGLGSEDRVLDGVGVRRGELAALAEAALAAGVIGKVRAWEALGLPLTEPWPGPGLDQALRGPPLGREAWLKARAQRHLRERHEGRALHATQVQPVGGRYQVSVVEGGVGQRETSAAGTLWLDAEGRVLADEVDAGG